ncbi:uncharacterized protein LOC125541714 isoform X2 [Triticum urartu]|uniref:uncharacterized protein LOC125541714 isoform X2 n=1 Tax=Triticum urartu TaxID=4572 RepID=UPI002043C22D|nr:uncharacterized protein LOC125541714 isoform X2 [Triticum urartu]
MSFWEAEPLVLRAPVLLQRPAARASSPSPCFPPTTPTPQSAYPPYGVGGGSGESAAGGVGPVQGGGGDHGGELREEVEIKKRLLVHARENGNGHGHVNGGEAEEDNGKGPRLLKSSSSRTRVSEDSEHARKSAGVNNFF